MRGLWRVQRPQPPRRGCPGPRGGAGWEGRGPPGVGGRAGGWVGRVCIGAGWFRRGGGEVGSGVGAGAGSPGAGAPRGPGRFRATAQPRGCCGGPWDPRAWGWRGGSWCCWEAPAERAWQGWGALVSPGAGEGSGRAGVSQREREAAAGPADVRRPRGGARGSPGHTWVQSRAWRRVAGAGMGLRKELRSPVGAGPSWVPFPHFGGWWRVLALGSVGSLCEVYPLQWLRWPSSH